MDQLKAKFQRDGFVKIPKSVYALDGGTVHKLRDEFDKLFDGHYETGIYPDEIHWRSGISKPEVTRELCNAWKASKTIQTIVASQKLGALACRLMGWKSSRLGQDDVIYKPSCCHSGGSSVVAAAASQSVVGYHQDGPYISDNFVPPNDNCLTMWIALDDTDEENGALEYAPGSHRWGQEQHQRSNGATAGPSQDVSGSSFHVKDSEDYRTPLRRAAEKHGICDVSIVRVNVPSGELVVHHQNVWHGSGPNRSTTRLRRSLVAHLIDGKVRWRAHPRPHYIYGRYCLRGEAIPREDFFPITHVIDPDGRNRRTAWLDDNDGDDE